MNQLLIALSFILVWILFLALLPWIAGTSVIIFSWWKNLDYETFNYYDNYYRWVMKKLNLHDLLWAKQISEGLKKVRERWK